MYFTLGQGSGYIFFTYIYELYGGSKTFFVGAFILAANFIVSQHMQPIQSKRYMGRLYGQRDYEGTQQEKVAEIV